MKQLMMVWLLLQTVCLAAQDTKGRGQYTRGAVRTGTVQTGAENLQQYLPLLQGKKIAVFANQTSIVGTAHLVDTLSKLGVQIQVIFGPEHGFRGTADAGEKIGNYTDTKTGIPVVSLYGSKRKPAAADLTGVDVMLFDIQDVGVRFYTYISSLEYYLEAAIENGKHLIVLDRPNPNGHYVDGPVLEPPYKSFVGMQPIPIVYGMTIGEYTQMIYGEQWYDKAALTRGKQGSSFELTIIPCNNYNHTTLYTLPVKPSPNLPDMQSIYLYPSTCFFEGTVLSEGRGTTTPFQVFGHPSLPKNLYAFTPRSRDGAKNPKLQDQPCYGWNLGGSVEDVLQRVAGNVQIKWLQEAYRLFPNKEMFFLKPKSGKPEDFFFNKLAGNSSLMQQLEQGKSEAEIRNSWEPALQQFKTLRKKYLLYKDFE